MSRKSAQESGTYYYGSALQWGRDKNVSEMDSDIITREALYDSFNGAETKMSRKSIYLTD